MSNLSSGLDTVLAGVDGQERENPNRPAAGGIAHLAGTRDWAASLALLQPAMKPIPCLLETQDLVELLKLPTCVESIQVRDWSGKAKMIPGPGRIILDQLEQRYGQRFRDRWEFVPYAEQHHLGLDFSSPLEIGKK